MVKHSRSGEPVSVPPRLRCSYLRSFAVRRKSRLAQKDDPSEPEEEQHEQAAVDAKSLAREKDPEKLKETIEDLEKRAKEQQHKKHMLFVALKKLLQEENRIKKEKEQQEEQQRILEEEQQQQQQRIMEEEQNKKKEEDGKRENEVFDAGQESPVEEGQFHGAADAPKDDSNGTQSFSSRQQEFPQEPHGLSRPEFHQTEQQPYSRQYPPHPPRGESYPSQGHMQIPPHRPHGFFGASRRPGGRFRGEFTRFNREMPPRFPYRPGGSFYGPSAPPMRSSSPQEYFGRRPPRPSLLNHSYKHGNSQGKKYYGGPNQW